MKDVYIDMHVHIGASSDGQIVKVTASKDLNFENIANESLYKKGINFVGIIDCQSPRVIKDIYSFLENKKAFELENGGIIYDNKICIILGAEIETSEINEDGKTASAHNLCYFPHLKDIINFSKTMSKYIKNINLSTQRARLSGYELVKIVKENNGEIIPAHIFTPFKSYYGNCTRSLKRIFKERFEEIYAVELGLSADTELADYISELKDINFLTSSDAHSIPKIGREYTKLRVEELSFKGLFDAIKKNSKKDKEEKINKNEKNSKNNKEQIGIIANYGMDPKLGKYHRTYCDNCKSLSEKENGICKKCGSKKIVYGVYDRILDIKDKDKSQSPKFRPKYVKQVPLEFLPGFGKKTITNLLDTFGTEMDILHNVEISNIKNIFNEKIALEIQKLRKEEIKISEGGGGNYGKVK